ncbi:MAG: COR domain-containing protein [Sedimentisphaerales bacterium]
MDEKKLLARIEKAAKEGATTLDLSHNDIKELPAEIWQLTKLTELNLSNNQLSWLPAEIGQLTNLTVLYLYNNQLSSLPTEIGQLTNLTKINISGNQLSSLPAEIGQLKNLTHLDLGSNHLSEIPAEIGKLTNLTVLYLWGNRLSSLPAEIWKQTNLTTLWLGSNQFSWLPAGIGQLKNLKRLYLYKNQLSSLPVEIGQLTNLTQLDLSDNQLSELPVEILKLNIDIKWEWKSEERGIFPANNPWERPPAETIKRGKEAVKQWFEALKKGEKSLNEVKVLLVGYGGAGKTSLVRRLTKDEFDKDETKTHGVRITNWKIRVDGEDIMVHFWDYGGQGIMQATHRMFFSHRSLYVLVIDARQESDPEEWLKNIESIGGKSPVLVVINKIDENVFGLNEPELKRRYTNIEGFYHLSCESGDGIISFKRDLQKHVAEIEMRTIKWPMLWAKVRERLEQIKENYITYSKYETICEQEGVAQEARQSLIGILNDLGVLLYFPNRHLEVLNPEWATEGIYKIINSQELKKCKGKLPGNKLEYVLNEEKLPDQGDEEPVHYSIEEQTYIIELMKKFELCYELNNGTILVPDLLDEQEPTEALPKKADLRFYFEYDFLPAVIMPRFMVKSQVDLDDKLCWRSGAVLKSELFKTVAVVKRDNYLRRIHIDVTGSQSRDYLATIRNTIQEINNSFEKLDVKEWVPLPDEPDYAVKYNDLLGHYLEKRSEKFVGELRKGYSVVELLSGIEDPLDREFGRFQLYPPFFEILPGEDSFADAWEIFCCDVLNRHEKTTEIIRRKAPEGGVDLLWREKKQAYQCKSVIDPATNRFDVSKAVESVKAALAKRKETGWKKFYICSNVDITGPQEKKLREACPRVDMTLLTPSFWLPRCREQHAHLRSRFSELKRPHERY